MTLETQEVWSELFDEHFLVSVYDWVHATLECSVMGVPYFPVSAVSLTENDDCIYYENIKDVLGAKRSVSVKTDLSGCKFL